MKKLLLLSILTFAFCLSAKSQNCTELVECNQKLDTAARIINRQTDESKAKDKAIEALKAEIAARESLDKINNELLAKKDEIIKNQADLIKILEKETGRKISFFWGIIKIRY